MEKDEFPNTIPETILDKSIDNIEVKPLDIVSRSPLLIDNKQIYYQGFLSLSEEDKAKVLLGFLVTNNTPSLDNLEELNPVSIREKNNISKENKIFKLKFYGIYGILIILGITAIAIIGTFMYLSLDKGVLDENGVLTGILTTFQEVLKVLFTDPTSSSL